MLPLYENIKILRESLDMSQDELAKKVGYSSRTSIAKIESGLVDISQSKIVAFANALNTTPAYLMGWEDETGTTDLGLMAIEISKIIGADASDVYDIMEKLNIKSATNENIERIKKELSISATTYYGFSQPTILDDEDTVTFPVIGEIAAGYEHIAVEDWNGDTAEIPTGYLKGRPKDDFFVLTVHGDSMYPLFLEGDKVLVLKQTTLNKSGDIGVIIYNGDTATLKKVEFVKGENWLTMIPINPMYPPKRIEGSDLEQCKVIGIPKLLIRDL